MSSLFTKLFIIVLASCTTLAFTEDTLPSSENCPKDNSPCRTTLRHIEAGGVGYSQGYTTLEAFLAPSPNLWSFMPILDARAHLFDNGKWAANAGLGVRTILRNRVYGINAYYDYRNTSRLHYNQIGLGLETLGALFDVRLNGYLPVGNKLSAPYNTQYAGFSNHNLILSRAYQYALKGVNAEIGFHFGKTRLFDFYAAAGPYYYKGEIGDHIWGGEGRLVATFKDYMAFQISDSYDNAFHNRFQGQISFTIPLGSLFRSKKRDSSHSCQPNALMARMVQPINRQEIIPVDTGTQQTVATDPTTGQPLFFVFVNNTSSSLGTYESPYPTLALAQANSKPGDIIYVFPGDGSTTGMNAGITLKAAQKFWGSGVSYTLQTNQGTVILPAQSSSAPKITNADIDTDGNAITLATNNVISGFNITSPLNDAIYGADLHSLEVSSCVIESATTYALEASFSGDASISLTNNQLLNNVNGIFLTLNGTSTLVCSDNTFQDQTSVSSVPLDVSADSNTFTAHINNNLFDSNTTGSVRFNLENVVNADINLLNNTITNNGTGSQASLGSSIVLISTGVIDDCSILVKDNTFSENTSNSLYLHTSGEMTNLEVTASNNTMSDNGGSGLVIATPVDTLTLTATDNTITGCDDNGISIISSGTTTTGTVTINNNTLTDIGNTSNGISLSQNFSTLNLTVSNNEINRCEGTGILSYSPTGIDSLTLDISDNIISNCENASSNAASGIDIEQYTGLAGSVTNNTLSDNTGVAVMIGSTLSNPTVCMTLTDNTNDSSYLVSNPVGGTFNLSPCDVDTVNTGTITRDGTINAVRSCPDATSCP